MDLVIVHMNVLAVHVDVRGQGCGVIVVGCASVALAERREREEVGALGLEKHLRAVAVQRPGLEVGRAVDLHPRTSFSDPTAQHHCIHGAKDYINIYLKKKCSLCGRILWLDDDI